MFRLRASRSIRRAAVIGLLAAATVAPAFSAMQQSASAPAPSSPKPQPTQPPIGYIDISATTEKILVSGAVTLGGASTLLGNGSTVTAGSSTLPIHLSRGGELDLCATTQLHLSQQASPQSTASSSTPASDPNSPLMLALDRGAIEAHYALGKDSDVILTPDLRILLSGPGQADVRIRVNSAGDTCVDNRGPKHRSQQAPYLTVSEQIGTGVYRVQPNQRVMFEHGSVRDVVDRETQPCGCPASTPVSVASAGVPAPPTQPTAKPGAAVARTLAAAAPRTLGGPSSTPADTAFPLAESEGLAPPPALPTRPVVAPGEIHSEVTTTLRYVAPSHAVPTGAPSGMATPASAATVATQPAPGFGSSVSSGPVTTAQAPTAPPKPRRKPGILRKIGRFFAKVFG